MFPFSMFHYDHCFSHCTLSMIIICLHTVIWYQVPLSDTNYLYTIICSPVSWGCRIHWLLLCREVRPLPMNVLHMNINNLIVRWSLGEYRVPLHCSQVHRVVASDRVLSMGSIERFDIKTECKQMSYAKLNCLK